MHRFVIAFIGVTCFSVANSSAYAQSGSRNPTGGTSSSSSTSSFGGGGTGIAPSSGRFSRIPFQYRSGVTLAERVEREQAQIAFNRSQSDAARAIAQRSLQGSRKSYYEEQVAKQSRRIANRNRREQSSAELRARNIRLREQRELDKTMQVASLMIHWPESLQNGQYAERLSEIEAFSKLHASLRENDGIKAGFHTAVRGLALQILKDEQDGVLSGSDSEEVRAFVRVLNKNYGQFPSGMKRSTSAGDMLLTKM